MKTKSSKAAGRPLAFDRDRALDCAMRIFWEKGFEGTSLNDLTTAMGIRPPSLYAAFGNKQKLFEESLDRYTQGPVAYMQEALAEPTAFEVAARILRQTAEFLTTSKSRGGCMTIEAALVGGKDAQPVRQKLIRIRRKGQDVLRLRFERAKSEGDLSKTAHAADLARFVSTIFQGMTIQAINGASRQELLRVAEMALQVWPGSTSASIAG